VVVLCTVAGLWGSIRSDGTPVFASHNPDPTAQRLYIRGRYLMDTQTEEGLRQSIDCFRRAVELDSQFAAAYAGLADAYNVLSQYGYMPPREGMEEARRAAQRAIQIEPRSAEGHVSLAAILEAYDWNWREAEREYRRALQLNPWLPNAHLWYGMFLRDQGRLSEALPELQKAAQLDPFSLLTNLNLAHAYMQTGDYTAAAEQAQHASDRSPQSVSASVILANAYKAQSRSAEAEEALERALEASGDNPHALSVVACAFAKHGKTDETRRLQQRLEELARQRYVSPFDRATVSLTLGDDQQAVTLFEEAYRQRSSGLIFLRHSRFSKLRNMPQFNLLMEKMQLAG
jgi:serine/threonine-protein kinase